MAEFPTTREMLADFVGMRGWTPKGQVAIAQYIYDIVQRWGLGDARLHSIPEGFPGIEQPTPLIVTVDVGNGVKNCDETIINEGHSDTVKPDDYPADFHRAPDNLVEHRDHPDICYGLGSLDMLCWLAGTMTALRIITVARHRHYRIFVVPLEEKMSQGTYALFRTPLSHLVQDTGPRNAAGISGEIKVNSKLDDPPELIIGRPGRMAFELNIHGPGMHSGSVDTGCYPGLAMSRTGAVMQQLGKDIFLPGHPNDPLKIMPEPMCQPSTVHSIDPKSLSTASGIVLKLEAFTTHPGMDISTTHKLISRRVATIIGDEDFTLRTDPDRPLDKCPFIKPWLERPDHPFVQHALHHAKDAVGQDVTLAAGRGVAEESIFVHNLQIPMVTFPSARGEGEHGRNECCDVGSIQGRTVEWQKRLLAHDGSLIR